jgi:hypothetical protein
VVFIIIYIKRRNRQQRKPVQAAPRGKATEKEGKPYLSEEVDFHKKGLV